MIIHLDLDLNYLFYWIGIINSVVTGWFALLAFMDYLDSKKPIVTDNTLRIWFLISAIMLGLSMIK